MKLTHSKKWAWISGEVCETSAIYFSDTCGHQIQKEFRAKETFTRCPTCLQAIRWIRLGTTESRPGKTSNFDRANLFQSYWFSPGAGGTK